MLRRSVSETHLFHPQQKAHPGSQFTLYILYLSCQIVSEPIWRKAIIISLIYIIRFLGSLQLKSHFYISVSSFAIYNSLPILIAKLNCSLSKDVYFKSSSLSSPSSLSSFISLKLTNFEISNNQNLLWFTCLYQTFP